MLRILRRKDWRSSAPHLLFLTNFRSPRSAVDFAQSDRWGEVLGENPRKVMERYVKEGLLEPADLAGLLDYKFKVPQLKEMLRHRELKVSGRKADLIARLVEADPARMQKTVRGLEVYVCTAEGQTVAEEYLKQEADKRAAVEQAVWQALKEKQFKRASELVAAFEAEQVFSRGIGMDWAHHDPGGDVNALKTIFSSKSKILAGMPDSDFQDLRLAAGMMYLWGTNQASQWLPAGFETGKPMDADAAARMLGFHANHQRRLADYRGHVKTVQILGANDRLTCPACKKLANRKYRLDDVPELPCPDCTSEMGCRCMIVAEEFSF
jgi:hypothetical protein